MYAGIKAWYAFCCPITGGPSLRGPGSICHRSHEMCCGDSRARADTRCQGELALRSLMTRQPLRSLSPAAERNERPQCGCRCTSMMQYNVVLLGGLSGRLDQTMHTLSYLHKQRKHRPRMMAVTDESLAWVLDAVIHDPLSQSQVRRSDSFIGPHVGRAHDSHRSNAAGTNMWFATRRDSWDNNDHPRVRMEPR